MSPGTPLLNLLNPTYSSSYYQVQWLYYAQAASETFRFGIQNNPSYTQIDDVSVMDGATELLCNGGFETGSMTCWSGANHISAGGAHTGTYCYNDGVVSAPDYIWQTFSTTPGDLMYLSFWIAWGGSGGGLVMYITITP